MKKYFEDKRVGELILDPSELQKDRLYQVEDRLQKARDAVCAVQRTYTGGDYLTIFDVRGPEPSVMIPDAFAAHNCIETSIVHSWLGAGLKEGRNKRVNERQINRIYNPQIIKHSNAFFLQVDNIGDLLIEGYNKPAFLREKVAYILYPTEELDEWRVFFRYENDWNSGMSIFADSDFDDEEDDFFVDEDYFVDEDDEEEDFFVEDEEQEEIADDAEPTESPPVVEETAIATEVSETESVTPIPECSPFLVTTMCGAGIEVLKTEVHQLSNEQATAICLLVEEFDENVSGVDEAVLSALPSEPKSCLSESFALRILLGTAGRIWAESEDRVSNTSADGLTSIEILLEAFPEVVAECEPTGGFNVVS